MKKIIFTVTNDLSYDQRMQRICSSLARHGFNVILTGRKLKTSLALPKEQPYHFYRIRCVFNKGKFFYAEFNIRLFFYLFFTRFDAACAIDPDTILPVLFSSLVKKKKRLFDAHEYFTEVPELAGRNVTKKCWEAICGFAIPRMNICYTVNESLADILSGKYQKPFTVIKNVPLLDISSEFGFSAKAKFILYQGAVNKGRGIEELLTAIKDINIEVVIAGSGDLSGKINEMVIKLGLQERVKMTGMLNPTELKKITASAWLGYNLLDRESLSYYYSLSNKFFDYIHAGIPSLSNDFPEYKKINDTFEVAVLCGTNPDSILKSIKWLLDHEDFYNKLKYNCLEAKKVYNWQAEEKKLLELYHGI